MQCARAHTHIYNIFFYKHATKYIPEFTAKNAK